MNFERLLKRKNELRDIQKSNLEEIEKEIQRRDVQEGKDFIETGQIGKLDGYKLNELNQKKEHHKRMGNYLIEAITKERKKERITKLQKLEKKIAELEGKRRGPIRDRCEHLRGKIETLKAESQKLKDEATALRSETFQFKREVLGDLHFRLPNLQQFLKDHYIAQPEELEKLVEEAYQQNEIALRSTDLETELIRGYIHLSLKRDSGEIEKIEPLTCRVSMAREHPVIMSEVKK